MSNKTNIHACHNNGNIAGVNYGEVNLNVLREEYKQQYYIHSAARVSNYFSWIKFLVSISSGAVAIAASALFTVKKISILFQILLSFSIVFFLIAILLGLLSFIGNAKFEESKALDAYQKYRNNEPDSTLSRVQINPWYSECGSWAFYIMSLGFITISSGVCVFWVEQFNADGGGLWVRGGIFFVAVFLMIVFVAKTRLYLFKADHEDLRVEQIDSIKVLKK